MDKQTDISDSRDAFATGNCSISIVIGQKENDSK